MSVSSRGPRTRGGSGAHTAPAGPRHSLHRRRWWLGHFLRGSARTLRNRLRRTRGQYWSVARMKLHLLLEPGRSIVGPAGVLLTCVLYRKTNNHKRFLIVDAAMNDLVRPSLYSAYHEIVPVSRKSREPRSPTWSDPCRGTGDFFARDRQLRLVSEGDLLAIWTWARTDRCWDRIYNTRGRPAEVLVDGAKSRLIADARRCRTNCGQSFDFSNCFVGVRSSVRSRCFARRRP